MTSSTEALKIVIGIPTYKRPQGLRKLLESLAKTQAPFTPHILVADNEGEGAGTKVVHAMVQKGYPFPLTVVAAPERGISQARNTLLQESFEILGAHFLAMVDDDERVEPDWIAELVSMQKKMNADIVWGWVLPEFETTPPSWTEGQTIYYREKCPDGKIVATRGAGNVLIKKSAYGDAVKKKLLFNCAFSLTGGEDAEFFERLKNQQAVFAFTSKAISHEYIPTSRISKKWAFQRAFRFGSIDTRILKMHYSKKNIKKWVSVLGKVPLAFIAGFFMMVLHLFNPPKRMKGILLMARQMGKISGIFGRYGSEYTVTHGS